MNLLLGRLKIKIATGLPPNTSQNMLLTGQEENTDKKATLASLKNVGYLSLILAIQIPYL